jgi:H+/Cl- antiporter ClcA
MAILVAIAISFIAKFLIYLIYFITNVSFYGKFSIEHITPADNTLGWWVVIIPAIGGVIVGFMALYGSKAIRGHGIPEAMEQILTNQSKTNHYISQTNFFGYCNRYGWPIWSRRSHYCHRWSIRFSSWPDCTNFS